MQSSSRSPPKGNGNGSPKKGNGNGNGNGHGNGNGNGNGNGKGNGNGNGNGKQPPRPQPGNDPSRSPKKSIAPGLAHSAESLSKDLQRFNITIPGPDNKPVATVQSHIIPYYCFMKDRENKNEIRPILRSGYSTSGKPIDVLINAFPINKFPEIPVYQYEVTVAHPKEGVEQDRRVIRRCWNCETRKLKLPNAIFDGVGTAWSLKDIPRLTEQMVYKGGKKNPQGSIGPVHGQSLVFTMLPTRKIYLSNIGKWLRGQQELDEGVIEALNFLDHLIRDWPATQFTAHKRAFFFPDLDKHPDQEATSEFYCQLHGGATVHRGVFQAIRPSATGLLVNLDAAHGVFFSRISLMGVIRGMLDAPNDDVINQKLMASWDHYGNMHPSDEANLIDKKIRGLRVMPNYEGCPKKFKGFNIRGLLNGHAMQYLVDIKDHATGKVTQMTVFQYFEKKYNLRLRFPKMPLVQMENASVVYPIEFLVVKGLQRWPFKLTEQQTADMIRYTAKKPGDRLGHIMKCKKFLAHEEDPQLREYGLEISPSMLKTKARLLPNPEIQFGNAKHNPGTSGRWDLRGKKFYRPNVTPLKSWGVGYFKGQRNSVDSEQVNAFIDRFMKTYKQHGGEIKNRPFSMELKEDVADAVSKLHSLTKKTWAAEPQLLIFVVTSKDALVYLRIKKSCDCRFGVASQVLQSRQIIDNKPQYHSNVLMKVNAKLGGVTSRVVPTSQASALRPYSVIIGADVTHPMLGVWTPSLAAMCISNDINGVSYMGGSQCNGDKEEIIREENVHEILTPLLREWISTIGQGKFPPKFVYYFRDGVSESEYKNVLNKEIPAIKRVFAKCCGLATYPGKVTAVIANKRHHIRAFPNPKDMSAADRNGNPLPGTLIDRDITSPHGWDFLLYAHSALQGTARPVHYKVVLDEIGHKPEQLENMIYEQSYQYVRSTTPVSIHPAIYYSHLITARARHHENVAAGAGLQWGNKIKFQRSQVGTAERLRIQRPEQLLPPLNPDEESKDGKDGKDGRESKRVSPTRESAQLKSSAEQSGPEQSLSLSQPPPKHTVAGINYERLAVVGKTPDQAISEMQKLKVEAGVKPTEQSAGPQNLLLPMRGTENRLQYRMWWM